MVELIELTKDYYSKTDEEKEVIKKLKTIDSEVKAIVSSGYSSDPIMANYEDYGFCAVAAKPYSIKEITETLRNLFMEKK